VEKIHREFFMPRIERFTFVVNSEEREMISKIAKELQRSDSDAVRYLILSKAKELNEENQNNHKQEVANVGSSHS